MGLIPEGPGEGFVARRNGIKIIDIEGRTVALGEGREGHPPSAEDTALVSEGTERHDTYACTWASPWAGADRGPLMPQLATAPDRSTAKRASRSMGLAPETGGQKGPAAHHSSPWARRSRPRATAARTWEGAVAPKWSRAATEPSTVSTA